MPTRKHFQTFSVYTQNYSTDNRKIKEPVFYIIRIDKLQIWFTTLTFHQLGHLTWPILKALMAKLGAAEARVIRLLDTLVMITPVGQQIEQRQYNQQAQHQTANAPTANVTHTHFRGVLISILHGISTPIPISIMLTCRC